MSTESKVKILVSLVGVVMLVVVIVYAIFSGRAAKIEIPGALSVELVEKKPEQGSAHRVVVGSTLPQPSAAKSEWSMDVPGEDPLPLSDMVVFYIDPPASDPQAQHKSLLLEMLAEKEINRLYRESDDSGMFSTWLRSSTTLDGRRCLSYTTLYKRWDGRVEVGYRLACPTSNGWSWAIDPDIRELVRGSSER